MTAKGASISDDLTLKPLDSAQQQAVDPAAHVWLNASAGTGKTQVLSARVLRLLLDGVAPDSILCITFTKAGAAEMAHRVHERLALWVGCTDADLRTDLHAIGADQDDPDLFAAARTMFARVIDSRAGAIRVQTIHGFCQSLLASFPFEAAVLPGFTLIEGGEARDLRRDVLGKLLLEPAGEAARRRAQLGQLSRRLGEQGALTFVDQCASFFGRVETARLAPSQADVRQALGLPEGDMAAWTEAQLAQGCIDDADVCQLAHVGRAWSAATGQAIADQADVWLLADRVERLTMINRLYALVTKGDGDAPASFANPRQMGAAADAANALRSACARLLAVPRWCQFADDIAAGWALGADFAAALSARKLREGLAEFDDLIARTAQMLSNGELADWIRFKLDQRIDHLLIDEAQDTNAAQWTIADGLISEFFAGEGVRDRECLPSMFVVGDRKQAIFGFQGTDPRAFEAARRHFAEKAVATERPFDDIDLVTNFRSASAVLEFVDQWIGQGGAAAMGIDPDVAPHNAFDKLVRPGRVELWPPVIAPSRDDGSSEADDSDMAGGDDSWSAATDPASLKLASELADRIAAWIAPDGGIDGAPVRPDDILVLVRHRRALAARIVAQLQARNVPVAGVDRFKLADPLAVQDLLAALRFMVQPDDEYSLAILLVSPVIGWTQQQLYDEMADRDGMPLRLWLQTSSRPLARQAHARLEQLRAGADFSTPFRTLDTILHGDLAVRQAMLARMGAEANDAIDALLAEALAFEGRQIPSLIGFLDHVDRAPLEVKRQTEARGGLVRVMTVHGSKGLQAPIVILADATGDPTTSEPDVKLDMLGWRGLPLFGRSGKANRPPPVEQAYQAARKVQLEEHWRLFYVAATRAERLLVMTGSTKNADKPAPEHSWYAAAQATLTALPSTTVDVDWCGGTALRHASKPGLWAKVRLSKAGGKDDAARRVALPPWTQRSAPEEARPPRPLAPSQLGQDDAPQRPAGTDRNAAIRRGVLMHALIERLPDVAADARMVAAERWLAAQAGDVAPATRRGWAAEACAVLANPAWAALFGPDSLAEAPFSAVIDGGLVVAGTVDRLLVRDDAVLVVDYKTGAVVPGDAGQIAPAYLRQMAAYAAALAVIFPGRRVAAALLYTAAPRLIALPDDLLAAHKPGFDGGKGNYAQTGLEPDPFSP